MEFTHEQITEIISEITNGEQGLEGSQIQLTNATFLFKYAKNLLIGVSNASFSLGLRRL